MPGPIESSGDIEIFCHRAESAHSRSSVASFDTITSGDRVTLLFVPIDAENPPYSLKIISPTGTTIVDSILRDLPTGAPQSAPPIEFTVSARGVYRIEIREMKGRQRGEARLRVD